MENTFGTAVPSGAAEVMVLRCAGCGANLEIDGDIEQLTCSYCKTQQEVVRRGGSVALKKLGDAIARVQRGTDKTAAELAIPRLERELVQSEANRLRLLAEPVQSTTPRAKLSWAVKAMTLGLAISFFGIISIGQQSQGVLIGLLSLLFVFCGLGSIVGFVWLRVLRGLDRKKAKKVRDQTVNSECDAAAARITQQLLRARAVVEGN